MRSDDVCLKRFENLLILWFTDDEIVQFLERRDVRLDLFVNIKLPRY